MWTAADPQGAVKDSMSSRGGAAPRHRPLRIRALAAASAVLAVLMAGCGNTGAGPDAGAHGGGSAASSAAPDPRAVHACRAVWGDPTYTDPISREVLDRVATAPERGPEDPDFYALTADRMDRATASAPPSVSRPAGAVSMWLREQPARGKNADIDAFAREWSALAKACAPSSAAARWHAGLGRAGHKPAALVCADIVDTPQTLAEPRSANVLSSILFDLVGLSARHVSQRDIPQLRRIDAFLQQESAAVDDEGVRSAVEGIRAPVHAAVEGKRDSPGLREPMKRFDEACAAAGYDTGGRGR